MSDLFKEIKFLGSFPNVKICPDHKMTEFAFIGRSNVGKSSLINMLSDHSGLAKTSKKPGKTQMINMFTVDQNWCMVDLPGYGYAITSKKNRQEWRKMIYDYLEFRENLVNTFVLIDFRHELQKIDLDFINWLGSKGIPFSIIYTKTDRVKKSKSDFHLTRIQDALKIYWDELPMQFFSSSINKIGREDILTYIVEVKDSLK